jgi:hypothetical protein
MASLADLVAYIKKAIPRNMALTGKFQVATTSPFTVYIDGSATAIPARKVVGLSYTVGTTGDYVRIQGKSPTCYPTV